MRSKSRIFARANNLAKARAKKARAKAKTKACRSSLDKDKVRSEIQACIAAARAQGWTGIDQEYELTAEDIESIALALDADIESITLALDAGIS